MLASAFSFCCFVFFFNDTATTEIYTLSLHDALPIRPRCFRTASGPMTSTCAPQPASCSATISGIRSEEHTSELQSRPHLVCRLLLEKKKKIAFLALFTYEIQNGHFD